MDDLALLHTESEEVAVGRILDDVGDRHIAGEVHSDGPVPGTKQRRIAGTCSSGNRQIEPRQECIGATVIREAL